MGVPNGTAPNRAEQLRSRRAKGAVLTLVIVTIGVLAVGAATILLARTCEPQPTVGELLYAAEQSGAQRL